MERPASLKEEFYSYIVDRLAKLSLTDLRVLLCRYGYAINESTSREAIEGMIMEQPASFLYHDYHVLDKPDSSAGTFISFNDREPDEHLDYLIDKEAAEAIALNQRSAILRRLLDGKPFLVPTERIRNVFKNHCDIDYREIRK